MPLRNILDHKLETVPDAVFEKICGRVIKGFCIGAALYFGVIVAAYMIWRG